MEVIPIHHKPSEPVRKYYEIEDDAVNMMHMLDARGFHGHHAAGYALAHAQVSENPRSFFVLDMAMINDGSYTERVIINPQILEASVYLDEPSAFALFMGMNEHDGRQIVPGKKPNAKEYMEGCLSFPHRRAKRINRFDRIKVTFQTKGGMLGLKRHTLWLSGLASQVFQHEYDHCQGNNIFFASPKR